MKRIHNIDWFNKIINIDELKEKDIEAIDLLIDKFNATYICTSSTSNIEIKNEI